MPLSFGGGGWGRTEIPDSQDKLNSNNINVNRYAVLFQQCLNILLIPDRHKIHPRRILDHYRKVSQIQDTCIPFEHGMNIP